MRLDAELGWTVKPSGHSEEYRANSEGIRSDVSYSDAPAPGVLRIATFGDSFTHGDEVANADTWQHQLGRELERCETLNLGVPAYGPGQSLMRFRRRGPALGAHVVFLGYSLDNLRRAINVFRPFLGPSFQFPLTKPRFQLRDDELKLVPNPLRSLDDYRRLMREPAVVLPELGRHDHVFARRYGSSAFDVLPSVRVTRLVWYALARKLEGSEYAVSHPAFDITFSILKQACEEVRASGAIPIVLFFPADFSAIAAQRAATYEPLAQRLRNDEERVVDLTDASVSIAGTGDPLRFQLGTWGHYSAAGHRVVAAYLRQWLTENALDTPEAARRAR